MAGFPFPSEGSRVNLHSRGISQIDKVLKLTRGVVKRSHVYKQAAVFINTPGLHNKASYTTAPCFLYPRYFGMSIGGSNCVWISTFYFCKMPELVAPQLYCSFGIISFRVSGSKIGIL